MKTKMKIIKLESGFTLIELIIAMFISSIMGIVLVTFYVNQLKTYSTQEDVSVLQQNLRAAMYYLESDIRIAGCDPKTTASGSRLAGAALTNIVASEFEFTMDITGGENDGIDNDKDGNIDESDEWYNGQLGDVDTARNLYEQVNYHLSNDADNNGIADGFPCNLEREENNDGNMLVLAEK